MGLREKQSVGPSQLSGLWGAINEETTATAAAHAIWGGVIGYASGRNGQKDRQGSGPALVLFMRYIMSPFHILALCIRPSGLPGSWAIMAIHVVSTMSLAAAALMLIFCPSLTTCPSRCPCPSPAPTSPAHRGHPAVSAQQAHLLLPRCMCVPLLSPLAPTPLPFRCLPLPSPPQHIMAIQLRQRD